MISPSIYVNEWQCSINMLNATVYRKFQHASLHNPIKNTSFNLPKKNSTLREKGSLLFKSSTQYKLPIVRTYRKKQQDQKQNLTKESQSYNLTKKPAFRQLETPLRETSNCDRHSVLFRQKFCRFKENIESMFNFGERDRYFSYFYNVVGQISLSIQESQNKQQQISSIIADLQILIKNIDRNRSVLNTLKKITVFKRNSSYFEFKKPQTMVLYHVLLAQLEFYERNLENSIKQFQFCEYYCRKQGLENLTLSFLWQMTNLNISQSKYENADENLRNLLEMAVICKQKKAVKYALEKISVIYYYRGNSIMGQYYLKKSESGLSSFETQMYFKQYNRNDELKRLEHRLFNLPAHEQRVKRKNNPKLESDVWKQSKEDHEKNMEKYMESVNQMLKDHEHAKLGRQIKKIVKKVNLLGFTKNSKSNLEENYFIPLKQLDNRKTFAQQCEGEKKAVQALRKSLNEPKKKENSREANQQVQDNVTYVIKTHLSMNRQNSKISREQRWRRFVSFILTLEHELLSMVDSGSKQTSANKAQGRLKSLANES